MDDSYPDADKIDSTCDRRLKDTETPSSVLPRCNEEAVTWFNKPDGTRLYVCEEHAVEVLRFPSDDEEPLHELNRRDLDELAETRGINLDGATRDELLNRIAKRRNPEDIPPHPVANRCKKCGRITLKEDSDALTGKCPGCLGNSVVLSTEYDPG